MGIHMKHAGCLLHKDQVPVNIRQHAHRAHVSMHIQNTRQLPRANFLILRTNVYTCLSLRKVREYEKTLKFILPQKEKRALRIYTNSRETQMYAFAWSDELLQKQNLPLNIIVCMFLCEPLPV